jgi:hypothetical protein
MPSLTLRITHGSDSARNILNELRQRVKESENKLTDKHKEWREAEERTLAYLPERDIDLQRRTQQREAGKPVFTTIQIPYSYAVLMSAHTYATSVFLGRSPIHQFTGRHGESMQNCQALEALIDYQANVGEITKAYYTWLYDSFKYGMGCVGTFWEDRYDNITSIQAVEEKNLLGMPTGKIVRNQTTMRSKTYSGNRVHNIQPWDFLWDTRYPLKNFQQGEYLALRFSISWNTAKRREDAGFYYNLENVSKKQENYSSSANPGSSELNRPETTDPTSSSTSFEGGLSTARPSQVNGYEVYVELIPKEWGLSSSEYPEKWVFTCTADFGCLIGAQPHGAKHCKFPAAVLPYEPEGYGLTTRGLLKVLEPVQNTIDWLINSHFYNVRAALNNTLIVDPSKTVMKDWLNPAAGKIIRMKPEAYGTDSRMSWSQVQINDVTQNHIRDIQLMLGIGERAVGINDQIMGMLNAGGRKTATEVRTSTSFGVNRLKTTAEWFSEVGFNPLAQMLVANSQQYYDGEQKFKIAGDLLQTVSPGFVDVNQDMIAGMYDFVPVDGTLPIDRNAQAAQWQQIIATVSKIPQIAMQYDLAGMFQLMAQTMGVKNITRFKVQLMPDQQLALQAQAGNSVPMGGGPQPGNPRSTSPQGTPQMPAGGPSM